MVDNKVSNLCNNTLPSQNIVTRIFPSWKGTACFGREMVSVNVTNVDDLMTSILFSVPGDCHKAQQ